jgi:hypothetical protein
VHTIHPANVPINDIEAFEDIKGVIRIGKSENAMAKRKKNKRANNDLQNIKHKTKARGCRLVT